MDVAETIYLNIAGFKIVILIKIKWPYLRKKLKKEIKKYFNGFLDSADSHFKANFKIIIIFKSHIPFIVRNSGKSFFINLFEENNNQTVTVSQTVSMLELQIILGEIINKLIYKNGGLILHGSAVNSQKGAIIFNGENGAGKSTVMKLLQPDFPALSDDSLTIRKIARKYYLYQLPFVEKNYWIKKTGKKYPINKIFIIKKSANFKITKITDKNYIFRHFSGQVFSEKKYLNKNLKYLIDFINNFDEFYFLYFAKNRKKLLKLLS